jgi:SCP-2 sterol transfer family
LFIHLKKEGYMTTYARIQRLTKHRGENIDKTFRRLADLLRNSNRNATLRCTILVGAGRRHWTFDLQGPECRLQMEMVKAPNLEIITREATWWEIAEGRLSPLEAFKRGQLRILGDTELGSHLLRHVAEGSGAASICGE